MSRGLTSIVILNYGTLYEGPEICFSADALKKKDDYHFEFVAERCQVYQLYIMADMKKPIEDIRKYAKILKAFRQKETMAQIERSYENMDEAIAIYIDLASEEDAAGWHRGNWHLKLMEI